MNGDTITGIPHHAHLPLELKLLGVPPKTGGSPEDATKYVMDQVARVRGLIKTGMLTPE